MKQRYVSACLVWLVLATPLFAQNYILSRTYKNGNPADAGDVSKTTTQIQYFDGLGRPVQTVLVGQSPSGKDIISFQEYDAFGREPKAFLPFTDAGATGAARPNPATLQTNFYSSNIPALDPADVGRPYTETTFEASPLNRPLSQRAAGNNSASGAMAYLVNIGTAGELAVKRYDFQENTNLTQTIIAHNANDGYYENGQLTLMKTTDENGKVMLEAKDKEGRVILKRALVNGSTYADTYYVYDDLGQLRAVLQPMYQENADAAKFAFLYRYDNRGRLTEKRVPGAEAVEMRYDQYDRLVLSRDGNQRHVSRNVWSFIKYDALNRPIMTGEINGDAAPSESALMNNGHHETLTGAGTVKYSLTNTLPNLTDENGILTVTYYDTYANWSALSYDNQYGITPETNLKGQTTGGLTRMLNPDGNYGGFLTHTIYYDANYRPIQTVKHIFGIPQVDAPKLRISTQYKYAVAAIVLKEKEQQGTSSSDVSVEKEYSYDHADRVVSVKHQITRDGNALPAVTIAAMDYNELGQLKSKWLHSSNGTDYRRRTDYSYNIRSWQTEGKTQYKSQSATTEQTQFSYSLTYSQGSTYTNGNISAMSWTSPLTPSGGTSGTYNYSYDGLNRLLSTGGTTNGNHEGDITYDLNGNIKTLKRWKAPSGGGGLLIDNLTYNYTDGNRLNGIQDASGNADGFKEAPTGVGPSQGLGAYDYDANGNLIKDTNKGIAQGALEYNLLNLVRKITLNGNVLEYYYDAAGTKHQMGYSKPSDPTKNETTRYVGSMEWLGNNLKRIATGEGQVIFYPPTGAAAVAGTQGGLGQYQYYLTDHLGNTRVVVNDSGRVLQRTDYYAFGLAIDVVDRAVNKYTYNGKELQPETNLLDYGARQYDAAVGRWFGIDPLADHPRQLRYSPYAAFWNNPVMYSDPDGRCPKCEEMVKNPTDGQVFKTTGATYTYGGGQWTRNGGQLNEVVVRPDGAYGSPVLAYTTQTKGVVAGYSAGYNGSGEYGAADVNVTGFRAEYNNNTGTGESNLALDGGVKVTGFQSTASLRGGTENINLGLGAEGNALLAEAKGTAGVLTGENNRKGVYIGGEAGVYALKGEVNPSINVFGYKLGFVIGGSLGSVNVGAGLGAYRDTGKGTFNLSGFISGSFIAGGKLGFEIVTPRYKKKK